MQIHDVYSAKCCEVHTANFWPKQFSAYYWLVFEITKLQRYSFSMWWDWNFPISKKRKVFITIIITFALLYLLSYKISLCSLSCLPILAQPTTGKLVTTGGPSFWIWLSTPPIAFSEIKHLECINVSSWNKTSLEKSLGKDADKFVWEITTYNRWMASKEWGETFFKCLLCLCNTKNS